MKNLEKLSIDLSQLDEELSPSDEKIEHRTVYDIPEEQGKLEGILLGTSHEIVMYRGEYRFFSDYNEPEYNFGNVKAVFSEETFLITTSIGGWIKHTHNNPIFGKDCPVIDSQFTCFRVLHEYDIDVVFEVSKKVVDGSLSIPVSFLKLLVGKKTATNLLQTLGVDKPNSSQVQQIPLRITKILHEAINPRLTGPTKQLYCQAKAVEYLCELVEFMEKSEGRQPLLDTKNPLIADLHDNLLNHTGRILTIAELAEQYGVSARSLNTQFKNEYGISIHQHTTKVRLERAHELVNNKNIVLKVIADNLGYSHVNHFITAFKREFGYTPGALRKLKGIEKTGSCL